MIIKQSGFTVYELYCMAILAGKRKLCGIPDGFSEIRQDERMAVLQDVLDGLIEKQIVLMDMDGKLYLHDEYAYLPDIYCDSKQYLMIVKNSFDIGNKAHVIWKYDNTYFKADFMDNLYYITQCDELEIRQLCKNQVFISNNIRNKEIIITQKELIQVKQFTDDGQFDEAHRVLLKNGVDTYIAAVIIDGLSEKANYFNLIFVDESGDDIKVDEINRLFAKGTCLEISTSVVNYRSCIIFKTVSQHKIDNDQSIIDNFFSK